MINILNADGTVNEHGGKYAGQDRYDARKAVVADMEEQGFFISVEDRKIELGHSDRSKTPVEPYLSDQWFVAMDELAQNAIDAVNDGRVRFYPARYAKTYLDWLGEKRDWCISRQLWWGHRIPIWYCETCSEQDLEAAFGGRDDVFWRRDAEDRCWLICAETDLDESALGGEHQLTQDEDVLDTWFSSALWPHATLGWPDTEDDPPMIGADAADSNGKNEVLDFFYPGSVLITSRDIITLWVARMVLTGLYNMGDIPFAHVHVHPKILDGFGQTMSKSKGNGCDPVDLIDKYGTDAVRFTIASFAGETQDVRLPMAYECPHCEALIPQALDNGGPMVKPETVKVNVQGSAEKVRMPCPKCKKDSQFSTPQYDPDPGEPVARMVSERFEYGRNFCNKLWNASRFALMNLEGYTPGAVSEDELKLEDRWILSRLSRVTAEMHATLGRYQFDAATRAIRDFTWNEFCDWYLEMLKPRFRDEELKPAAQRVLVAVLDSLIRLLAPFAPFVCEELWQRLNEIAPERGLVEPTPAVSSIMEAAWPENPETWQSKDLESRFERLQETIIAVRNVRAIYSIPPKTPLRLHIRCEEDVATEMQDIASQFDNLAKVLLEAAGADVERPGACASFSMTDADGFIPLEGIVDRDEELERQRKKEKELTGFITGHEKKLSNANFVERAPADVVNNVRETLAGLQKQLESVREIISQLEG
ncbi:MAG: hypothetical protein CMJ78_16470 [Planctomycetaceae bacterium]|nr:hypothetical protein [Planctomycetaceae bacterium]